MTAMLAGSAFTATSRMPLLKTSLHFDSQIFLPEPDFIRVEFVHAASVTKLSSPSRRVARLPFSTVAKFRMVQISPMFLVSAPPLFWPVSATPIFL